MTNIISVPCVASGTFDLAGTGTKLAPLAADRPKTAPGDQPPTPIRSCENKRRPMKLFVRPPRLSVGGPGASPGRRPTTAGHDIQATASRRPGRHEGADGERKSVVWGKSVEERGDVGG